MSYSSYQNTHPFYQEFYQDWITMRDTYRGERVVKEKGFQYLPPTSGMIADGLFSSNLYLESGHHYTPYTHNVYSKGYQAYQAYRLRASFPDSVKDAVESMLGVMHHKPAVIELPRQMEPMRESATIRKEGLQTLLLNINQEQIITGRVGLLLDIPSVPSTNPNLLPYIAMYQAEEIINWDESSREGFVIDNLNFVALDETAPRRQANFQWKEEQRERILILGEPLGNEPIGQGVYRVGVFEDSSSTFREDELIVPMLRGRTLDQIPFVFINAKSTLPQPDEPPLLGLARLALTIYRGEADYRQSLFMQGQDTLVVKGQVEESDIRIGANSYIKVPEDGDAKFIGVDSSGLEEQRTALENDKRIAAQKGGQLLDSISRERESGDALKIRVAARTAILNQIAISGAAGLEKVLKIAAQWIGANPEEVSVTPNLDFTAEQLTGKELGDLMDAKEKGAPLSLASVHTIMRDKDITSKTFEEETQEIEEERQTEANDRSREKEESNASNVGTSVTPENDPLEGEN